MTAIILALSLVIRIIGINQSLWLDEAISVNVVSNLGYTEIVKHFSPTDFHPPGYYLTLKAWIGVFGKSEPAVRMLSVLFSLVTIYMVYLLAGNGAAALVGFNPLLVYYSQEARMYSMVTMLLTVAVYFLVKKKYWAVSLFFGLSFLTFYGSIFLMAAVGLYLLINRKFQELAIIAIGPLTALLAVSPLLSEQYKNSKEMLGVVTNWDLVLGKANLKNLLLIPMKFSSGRISFEPKIVYYAISGIWAVYVFRYLFKKNIFSFIFWVTLVIGTIFSIFTPMLQYFRFLYLIPMMALVIRNNKLIVAGFLIFSLVYVLNSNFYREDWKSLSKDAGNKVYMIDSFGDPLKYYRPDIQISDVRSQIEEQQITVIPYGEAIHGVDHSKILEKSGYKKDGGKSYRDLSWETWSLVN